MYLEDIMLSELSQRQIPYDITYMWNLKNKTKESRNRLTDRTNWCCQKGRRMKNLVKQVNGIKKQKTGVKKYHGAVKQREYSP